MYQGRTLLIIRNPLSDFQLLLFLVVYVVQNDTAFPNLSVLKRLSSKSEDLVCSSNRGFCKYAVRIYNVIDKIVLNFGKKNFSLIDFDHGYRRISRLTC